MSRKAWALILSLCGLAVLWLAFTTQTAAQVSPESLPPAVAVPGPLHSAHPLRPFSPRFESARPDHPAYSYVPPAPARFGPSPVGGAPGPLPEAVWFRANATGDWVDGQAEPDATVWITATDGGGTLKGTGTTTAQPGGWFDGVNLWLDGQQTDLLPGDVVYVEISGGSSSQVTLIDIQGTIDVDTNIVSGVMFGGSFPASGEVAVWQHSTGQWFGTGLTINADGSYSADMSGQIDIQPGDNAQVWYYDPSGNWSGVNLFTSYLQANVQRAHDWINGEATPFTTVNVVVNDGGGNYKGGGESWTGGGTWFHINPRQPDGNGVNIETGDTVIVTAGDATAVLPVIGLEAAVDAAANVVSGHVPDAEAYPADVDVEIWDTPPGAGYGVRVQTDGNGDFEVDLTGEYDLRASDMVGVWYARPDGHRVGIVRSELRLVANLSHEWVGEATWPDAGVLVTVTDGAPAALKGTASGQADAEGGFWLSPSLDGQNTDLQPGDTVQVQIDGQSQTLNVPAPFTAEFDPEANTVSGLAPAGASLKVQMDGYGEEWITVPGNGEWSVDFSPYGDPQIWDQGHCDLHDVNGSIAQIYYYVQLPDMHVEKWVEGNNQTAPGGVSVFGLWFKNEGEAVAETVRLTDTLPANTSYVADTSGVTPDLGPGYVAWTLGPLQPGEQQWFLLALSNSADPGDNLLNQADIWTDDDYNPGNDHSQAEVWVVDGSPDLYVNKSPQPGDPAPGQTFLYQIDYGNNGPVPAGPVLLTDTLPAGTSFVSWYSNWGYNLWQEVETGPRFVLYAPAVPAHWGDQIYLRLRVDETVPPGTQLGNLVEIWTPVDSNWDDNWHWRDDVWVGQPRWNGWVDKSVNTGRLVPGGDIAYWLSFGNDGNSSFQGWLTDTLPAGTTFREAWIWRNQQYSPFPPDYVGDGVIAWDLGGVEPAEGNTIDLYLDIDPGTAPGTTLENCAQLAIDGEDPEPWNNASCAVDTVREPGPNLRVHKWYWWNWEGQLEYEIRMENIGSEPLDDTWVWDTYPVSTTWQGDWWARYGPWMTATHDADNRLLGFWVDWLNPSDAAGIGFRVRLDDPLINQQGLSFLNHVEAPIGGDVFPADNVAEVTAYTGPDLFAEKWLSDGTVEPGATLTFALRAGNQNQWPWRVSDQAQVYLTERLPEGMSYVTAYWPDGNDFPPLYQDPETGLVIWNIGGLGSYDWRWFYMVVTLDEELPGWPLLNRLEVWEYPQVDIDPVPENNTFVYPVQPPGMRVFLPLVTKN